MKTGPFSNHMNIQTKKKISNLKKKNRFTCIPHIYRVRGTVGPIPHGIKGQYTDIIGGEFDQIV